MRVEGAHSLSRSGPPGPVPADRGPDTRPCPRTGVHPDPRPEPAYGALAGLGVWGAFPAWRLGVPPWPMLMRGLACGEWPRLLPAEAGGWAVGACAGRVCVPAHVYTGTPGQPQGWAGGGERWG